LFKGIKSDFKKEVIFLMAVTKVGEKFRCLVCGNEVCVIKAGGGTLICCGQAMETVGAEAKLEDDSIPS